MRVQSSLERGSMVRVIGGTYRVHSAISSPLPCDELFLVGLRRVRLRARERGLALVSTARASVGAAH